MGVVDKFALLRQYNEIQKRMDEHAKVMESYGKVQRSHSALLKEQHDDLEKTQEGNRRDFNMVWTGINDITASRSTRDATFWTRLKWLFTGKYSRWV